MIDGRNVAPPSFDWRRRTARSSVSVGARYTTYKDAPLPAAAPSDAHDGSDPSEIWTAGVHAAAGGAKAAMTLSATASAHSAPRWCRLIRSLSRLSRRGEAAACARASTYGPRYAIDADSREL